MIKVQYHAGSHEWIMLAGYWTAHAYGIVAVGESAEEALSKLRDRLGPGSGRIGALITPRGKAS